MANRQVQALFIIFLFSLMFLTLAVEARVGAMLMGSQQKDRTRQQGHGQHWVLFGKKLIALNEYE